jgi:hypothetical protein
MSQRAFTGTLVCVGGIAALLLCRGPRSH